MSQSKVFPDVPQQFQSQNNKINLIQSLTQKVRNQQKQIVSLIKQVQQKKTNQNVKKIPFSMYKQFLIKTNSKGNIIKRELTQGLPNVDSNLNMFKMERSQNMLNQVQNKNELNENSYQKQNKIQKIDILTNKYLLLKLNQSKENNSPIFLSNNLQISTLEKLMLNFTNLNQDSQMSTSKLKQNHIQGQDEIKINFVQKTSKFLITKEVDQKIQIIKKIDENCNSLIQQTPKLNPHLFKKQSLPLELECNKLSSQIKALKQKLTNYNKVLEQQNANYNSLINGTYMHTVPQDISISCQSQFKPNFTQQKWNNQKQQYIQYIKYLKKQLQKQRNQKSEPNSKESQQFLHSFQKSQKPFQSRESLIQTKQIASNEKASNYKYLFKSPEAFSFSSNKKQAENDEQQSSKQLTLINYPKNNYQINKRKQNSKQKGKVFYIRN